MLLIRGRLWLRLIGCSTGRYMGHGSGQFFTVVPQFMKRKEQKSFLKTSRNDAVPDRNPLLLPGLTPPPKLTTSRRNCLVLLSHSKQHQLVPQPFCLGRLSFLKGAGPRELSIARGSPHSESFTKRAFTRLLAQGELALGAFFAPECPL